MANIRLTMSGILKWPLQTIFKALSQQQADTSSLAASHLTRDLEACSAVGQLQGEQPPEQLSDGRHWHQRPSDWLWHLADSGVGPAVSHHYVGVQVDAAQVDRGGPHCHDATDLSVNPVGSTWDIGGDRLSVTYCTRSQDVLFDTFKKSRHTHNGAPGSSTGWGVCRMG